MGVIIRLGRAPGVRRLVRRIEGPGTSTESPDDDDRDPVWCAGCRREVLLGVPRCPRCGGEPVTADELARRSGDLPPPPGSGPAAW